METNENENTLVQNLWDTVVLRGHYIAIQASLKKLAKSRGPWVAQSLSICLRLRA